MARLAGSPSILMPRVEAWHTINREFSAKKETLVVLRAWCLLNIFSEHSPLSQIRGKQ